MADKSLKIFISVFFSFEPTLEKNSLIRASCSGITLLIKLFPASVRLSRYLLLSASSYFLTSRPFLIKLFTITGILPPVISIVS